VSWYDDAMFSLELDLLNLEMLRARSSGAYLGRYRKNVIEVWIF